MWEICEWGRFGFLWGRLVQNEGASPKIGECWQLCWQKIVSDGRLWETDITVQKLWDVDYISYEFNFRLNTNQVIFNALKQVIQEGDIVPTDDLDNRVLQLFLFDFEQSGIHLDKDKVSVIMKTGVMFLTIITDS